MATRFCRSEGGRGWSRFGRSPGVSRVHRGFLRKTSVQPWPPVVATIVATLFLSSLTWSADRPVADSEQFLYLADHGLAVIRLRIEVDGKSHRHVLRDSFLTLCRSADRDHDGALTDDEFSAGIGNHPVFTELLLRGGQRPGNNANRPDFGTATKVPLEQAAEFLIGSLVAPLRVEFNGQQMRRVSESGQFLNRPIADSQLFERLDTDGNHKLTSRELERAARVLNKLDFDEDEIISLEELQAQSAPARPMQNRNPNARRSDSHLSQLSPDRGDAQFVRRVLSMYDGEAKGSAKDLRLDRNEVGLPAELFAKADADQDGYWDFDELTRFLIRPIASLEIAVRYAGEAAPTVEFTNNDPAGVRLISQSPGSVQFEIQGARFDFRVPASGSMGDDAEPGIKAQFQTFDANKNEYLEPSEFQPAGDEEQSKPIFRAVDANGDGKIYLDEFLVFNKLAQQVRGGQQMLTISNLGRTLFGPIDANGDGRLSQRELSNLKARLPEWDVDGDGKLVETEIPQQYRLILTRGANGMFGLNGAAVGIIKMDAEGNAAAPAVTAGPKWFQKMDRNRDGEVSAREFLGPAERFQKIDTNGDGAIDAGEAAAVK